VYLSWNSYDADRAQLSGYGSVSLNGSRTVYPDYSQTYTLTVWDEDGDSDQCRVTVHVDTDDDDDDYDHDYDRPSCTIRISNDYNGTATLSWWSEDARSAYIDGEGSVGTHGSKTVYSYGYKRYSMTVYGPGGSATCHTSHEVGYIPPPPTYHPPYVTLSNIPYTGLSPMGQAMYWLGMMLLATMAGYFIARQSGWLVPAGIYPMQARQNRQFRAFESFAAKAASPIHSFVRRFV
jgi:hypothetical protein